MSAKPSRAMRSPWSSRAFAARNRPRMAVPRQHESPRVNSEYAAILAISLVFSRERRAIIDFLFTGGKSSRKRLRFARSRTSACRSFVNESRRKRIREAILASMEEFAVICDFLPRYGYRRCVMLHTGCLM